MSSTLVAVWLNCPAHGFCFGASTFTEEGNHYHRLDSSSYLFPMKAAARLCTWGAIHLNSSTLWRYREPIDETEIMYEPYPNLTACETFEDT